MPRIAYIDKNFRGSSLETIEQANAIIADYAADGFRLTLRQLYYQFVARDLIPNTDKSYNRLGSLISDARLAGLIDWEAITDRLRQPESLSHWSSPESIVAACADQYRRDKWEEQEHFVEVWVEKDALSDVVERACQPLDVTYLVCRGYTSQSAMWEAGHKRFREAHREGKTPVVIHLGDHDPSGIDMSRDIEARLSMFARRPVHFERIALNYDQIDAYEPPPNPAKVTDSRFEAYREEHGEESWELDALEPRVLVDLITAAVKRYRDDDAWQRAVEREESERRALELIVERWDDVLELVEEDADDE